MSIRRYAFSLSKAFNIIIPEQFTVKAHPALFEGEGEGEEGEPNIEALYIPVYNWHTHSKPNFKVEYLKNGTREKVSIEVR